MGKLGEKGSAFIVLVFIFFVVGGIAVFMVVKTLTTSTQKVAEQSKALAVVLKEEYSNPFDKDTQYVNPFSSYKNPFDQLK